MGVFFYEPSLIMIVLNKKVKKLSPRMYKAHFY